MALNGNGIIKFAAEQSCPAEYELRKYIDNQLTRRKGLVRVHPRYVIPLMETHGFDLELQCGKVIRMCAINGTGDGILEVEDLPN